MSDYKITREYKDDPYPSIESSNIGREGKNIQFWCQEEYYDDYDRAKESYQACYIDGWRLEGVIEDTLEGNGIISAEKKCDIKIVRDDNPPDTADKEYGGITAWYEIKRGEELVYDEGETYMDYEDSDKEYKPRKRDPEYCPECGAELEEEYEEEIKGYVNVTDVRTTIADEDIDHIKSKCL